MSRHRNIKSMDFDEEYEGYYSCYGHSVEDDSCISPHTESQFLYDRKDKGHSMSSFLKFQPTVEEQEDGSEDCSGQSFSDSLNDGYSHLADIDKGKMLSCVEAMQDVVGDTISEAILIKAACDNAFDLEKSLNTILSGSYANSSTDEQNKVEGAKGITQDNETNKLCKKMENLCDVTKQKENSSESEFKNSKKNYFVSKKQSVTEKANKSSDLCNTDVPQNAKINENITASPTISEKNHKKLTIAQKEDKLNDLCKDDVPKDATANENIIPLAISEKTSAVCKDNSKLYEKERGTDKPLLNLVVIGHVDAGKSTLMGHMLYNLGFVAKKAMHKYEQESKKLGKASFMYAWVLDETSEERNRGITMDVAQSKFETPHRTINLLDAPGHKDFIPNMIAGASQADVAILVVDATQGEFETGFETGGQTREHTMLIRSLGVSQLAVAVNKMDNVNWDAKRYDNIVHKLSTFMKQVGFKEKDLSFVPCSGLTGENLTEHLDTSNNLKKWYQGPTLVDIIDSFMPPEREISKPFRMCISDVFKGNGSGFYISGKIECGCIQNGDKIIIMPAAEHTIVKGISINDIASQNCFAGDHVIIHLPSVNISNLNNGSIACDINMPIPVSSLFQARLVIFNVSHPITKGFPVILHYQNLTEQAIIKKLISQLHRSTGEVLRKHPRCLTKNSSAIVEIEVSRPICIELYRDFKELGRFMLRSAGSTIAAGLVTQIK